MTTETDPISESTDPGPASRRRSRVWIVAAVVVAVIVAGFAYFAVTFVPYLRDRGGEPMNLTLATWGRDHGLGPAVAAAEDFYYGHIDTVPVGGEPTESVDFGALADPSPTPTPGASESSTPAASGAATPSASPTAAARTHLNPPARLVSPATGDPLKGEGVWQPVGTKVSGIPATYATRVRPDAQHTSVLASLLWVDTSLATTMYIPGYLEPGGPHPSDGALPKQYWPDLLANVNGAFRLQDSQGGYRYRGTSVEPLVDGKATLAIHKDGTVQIGAWGRDIKDSPDLVVVRQNLDLIVDGGKSKTRDGDGFAWGATTHGENLAWRSAIGQRKDGSVVYIGSPGLSADSMADTLVAAGVQRAMVLDMNNWWVAGFYFGHDASGAPICHKLDPNIQEGCDRFLQRYKRDSIQFLAKPAS